MHTIAYLGSKCQIKCLCKHYPMYISLHICAHPIQFIIIHCWKGFRSNVLCIRMQMRFFKYIFENNNR